MSVGELAEEAIVLVERWLAESRKEPVATAAKRLAGVLSLDPPSGFREEVARR